MSEEEINIIKEQLYLENGKRASYIDITGEEAEEFIEAVEKLLEENEELIEELQMYVDTPINKLIVENEKLKADKNKLINYIAIRENKTHEEAEKEFEA